MSNFKHILVAMDEMPASRLLLDYVADLAAGRSEFRVHLFHAVGIPPGLLESPGAEHPAEQEVVQQKLEQRQEQWEARARSEALRAVAVDGDCFRLTVREKHQQPQRGFWLSTVNCQPIYGSTRRVGNV
jgi:nucleotide-binding universal stress UspA family protein